MARSAPRPKKKTKPSRAGGASGKDGPQRSLRAVRAQKSVRSANGSNGEPTPASPARPAPRLYRGRSEDERKRDRRARILDAALALFGTQGYAATGVTEISVRARVSTRHFYESFESREAVLDALYESLWTRTRGVVIAAVTSADRTIEERVAVGLDAFLHSYLDDPRVGRVCCIEVIGVSPPLEEKRRAALKSFARLLELQAAEIRGTIEDERESVELGAMALVGATNELIVDALNRARPPSLDLMREVLAALFAGAFRHLRPLELARAASR